MTPDPPARPAAPAPRTADPAPAGTNDGTLRPEHLYKTIGLFFLLLFFYRFFDQVKQTLLLVYAASIIAIALNPLVKRIPVHRKVVAGGVGMLAISLVGLILWVTIPPLAGQLREFGEQVPEFQRQLQGWGDWVRRETGLNVALIGEQTAAAIRNMFDSIGTEQILGGARGLLEVLLVPLIILIGGLYALGDPNQRLLIPLLRAVPADRRDAFYRIISLLGERLFNWVRGTLIAMLAVGVLSSLALYFIGVPYWLVLGIIIGLVEVIPIVGPWIGGVPAVVIAFLDEPIKGLWVAIAIIVIQQIESYMITPWAMSQAAKIHPLVTLFALILFGSIFGFLGLLLALPLVIFIWTVVQVLWVERALGSESDPLPPAVEE
jgi:predicted PurR-regulated permease PerM